MSTNWRKKICVCACVFVRSLLRHQLRIKMKPHSSPPPEAKIFSIIKISLIIKKNYTYIHIPIEGHHQYGICHLPIHLLRLGFLWKKAYHKCATRIQKNRVSKHQLWPSTSFVTLNTSVNLSWPVSSNTQEHRHMKSHLRNASAWLDNL